MKKMIKRNKICFLIFLFSILLAAAVFPFSGKPHSDPLEYGR